jgi:hypothetical protein
MHSRGGRVQRTRRRCNVYREVLVDAVGDGARWEILPPPFWTLAPGTIAHLGGPTKLVDAADLTVARLIVVFTLTLLARGNSSMHVVLLAIEDAVVDVEHGDVEVITVHIIVLHVEDGDVAPSIWKFVF